MRSLLLWGTLAGCGPAPFESPFIDGFEAKTSEGGYTDFFSWVEGGCGLKDGIAHCWGTEIARTFDGLAVSAFLESWDVARPACVLDDAGHVRCADLEPQPWARDGVWIFGAVFYTSTTAEEFCGIESDGHMVCESLVRSPGWTDDLPEWPSDTRSWRDVTVGPRAVNQLDELVSYSGGRVVAAPIDELRHGVAYVDGRVRREEGCLIETNATRFDREDAPEREALQDEATWCWRGPSARCWETPDVAHCEKDVPGWDAGQVAPRPSPTARQLRGIPLCGLEPDGTIVCGRWGDELDGLYAPEAFDLP